MRRRDFSALALLVLLVSGLSGCGGTVRDDYNRLLKGKVLVKGEPAAYAQVTLLPASDPKSTTDGAVAVADGDGNFGVRPMAPSKTMLKPGEYLVAVSWRIPKNAHSSDDQDYGAEKLPAKFQDPETSGLKVKIESSLKELPPIEVTP